MDDPRDPQPPGDADSPTPPPVAPAGPGAGTGAHPSSGPADRPGGGPGGGANGPSGGGPGGGGRPGGRGPGGAPETGTGGGGPAGQGGAGAGRGPGGPGSRNGPPRAPRADFGRPPTAYDADYSVPTTGRQARMAGLLAMLGAGLVGVVAGQVIAAVAEGFVIRADQLEPTGIETDLFHRLGFPFGGLGAPAILYLVVGLALLAMPTLLGHVLTAGQERLVSVAILAVPPVALVLATGSLLAVRNQIHQFTSQGLSPPPFARLGYAVFLLGAMGGAAVAIGGALATARARKKG
ncbi:MAG: hypothetical protein AB1673_07320 [Actinomycetota bacterium]